MEGPAEPPQKPKRVMHPNSLEALKAGREKAFAKRAALNIGEQKKLKTELASIKKADELKKRVENIKELRLKVVEKLQEGEPPIKQPARKPPREIPSDERTALRL